MTLRLYNTLTRTKEEFVPLDPKNVRLYVCGPTVYDYAHIGNARPAIVFDVVFRLLRHVYGEDHVTYVRNITDVDDKINARAAERGISIRELTDETYRDYHADVAALGCLPPTHEPRATEHIAEMVALIGNLIAAGHAYEASGHVLFDVSSKSDYGKLSRRSLDEMIAGARVEVAPYKRSAMDFVLWKPSDNATPGWESPWGRGRPGWHIECSAMSEVYLGETFDIHGGGIDLVFPHHENEIAQSEGAHHNHSIARVWIHNGFLNVEGEKMSKSLGNFVTIRELLNGWNGYRWPGAVMRFAMLGTHYRQPIDWTLKRLEDAAVQLSTFRVKSYDDPDAVPSQAFMDALHDDLNTPQAIVELNRLCDVGDGATLRACCNFLGIDVSTVNLQKMVRETRVDIRDDVVEMRIAARNAARKAKDYNESDRIRHELLAKGIVLKDNPDGTTEWSIQRGSRSGSGSLTKSRSGAGSRTHSEIGRRDSDEETSSE